jgi:hypothetical protein
LLNDYWYYETSYGNTRYNGTRYVISSCNLTQEMDGLYGSTLENNNYEWPTEYDWYE